MQKNMQMQGAYIIGPFRWKPTMQNLAKSLEAFRYKAIIQRVPALNVGEQTIYTIEK